jgi:hypothetical protein
MGVVLRTFTVCDSPWAESCAPPAGANATQASIAIGRVKNSLTRGKITPPPSVATIWPRTPT